MKKALLIGINYNGSDAQLSGCINDVHNVEELLLSKGYEKENITMLTDDTDIKPTRCHILNELLKLILSGAKQIYFHYSGHGSYIRDLDGDEADGRDETLVPVDYKENGLIIDDEIRGILQCINYGQTLFGVIDACHSGTSMDLRYNLFERISSGSMLMMRDRLTDRKNKKLRGQCIMLSGCMDNQTSADAYITSSSTFQGALTFSFLKALEFSTTYKELIVNTRKVLKDGGYSQLPNLSASYNLNLGDVIIV